MKNIADYDLTNLSYDSITGFITNTKTKKVYTTNHPTGYIQIGLQHKTTKKQTIMRAHRIAYYLHHGFEPDVIDHANGVKDDNRIVNLVSTTQKGNLQNLRRYKNSTYLVGVMKLSSGNFTAQGQSIRTGNRTNFGTYHTELSAHYVYTFYKQTHYALYNGNDLTDINGLTHPYFTGQLANIVATITDTSGKPALIHMNK